MDTSSTTQMAKSWTNIEDSAVPLERNLCVHPLAGLLWVRQFEEVLLELGWKKYRIGNVHLFIENKDYCNRYTCTSLTWLERSRIWLPCGRNSWKNGDLDEPTSSWPRIFGMYSTWMRTERDHYWAIHRKCLNHVFLLEQLKNYQNGKTSHKDGCVVLRHGRTCSKMRWEILRTGKQKDRAAVQGLKLMWVTRPSIVDWV